MKKTVYLLLITFLLLITRCVIAQQHDYPSYPKTDFDIELLDGSIEISEQMQIRGDVSYFVRFNVGVTDSVHLDAERIQIEDVLVNDRTMDYEFSSNQLTIFLDEQFERGDTADIRLIYTAQPGFGLLKNYSGTIFTSQLPMSRSHWLPVLDHPGVIMSTDLTVTHPSSRTLVMTGSEVSNSVVSVDQEETRFRSQYPVPVTALFFAIGAFEENARTVNNIRYKIYDEQPNGDRPDTYQLQNVAAEAVQKMENITGVEYPHSDLHIVLMSDLVWENRTFGAGAVVADLSRSLENQIKYGIAGQWAGVMVREMEWNDPYAVQFLQGNFANELDITEPAERDSLQQWDDLYSAVSMENIERFRALADENQQIVSLLPDIFSSMFNVREHPVGWQDLARMIYRESGQPFFERPRIPEPAMAVEEGYSYNVSIDHQEADAEVNVRFRTSKEAVEELVSVNVKLFTFNEVKNSELTFTGASDEIVVTVPSNIENISLNVKNRNDIRLDVKKPFMFWIYQLRNGENAAERIEAAKALQNYTDNPDLQLALLDFIEMESEAKVKAEIIKTLSGVTDGASGTSDLFLDRTGSNQPMGVRIESLRALAAYDQNERVISSLRSLIRSTGKPDIRKEAIQSLAEVTDLDQFTNIAESMIVEESVLYQVPLFLEIMAQKGSQERVVRLSETFLSKEFPYEVRSRALQLILDYDRSQRGWEERIENLIDDPDPRIRYISTRGLEYLSDEKRAEIIDARIIEEFDERVCRRLSEFR